MGNMKEKAIFLAEVAVAIALITFVQKKYINVPLVGEYLPGFTAR